MLPSSRASRSRVGADLDDLGLGVGAVGDDAGLRAGERARLVAEVVQGHRHQRARDALAGGQEHVHLARIGAVGDLLRQGHQPVGRLAPRGHHGHDVVAALAGRGDAPRHVLDLLRVGDRAAAELHRPQADGRSPPPPGTPAGRGATPPAHRGRREGDARATRMGPIQSSAAGDVRHHGTLSSHSAATLTAPPKAASEATNIATASRAGSRMAKSTPSGSMMTAGPNVPAASAATGARRQGHRRWPGDHRRAPHPPQPTETGVTREPAMWPGRFHPPGAGVRRGRASRAAGAFPGGPDDEPGDRGDPHGPEALSATTRSQVPAASRAPHHQRPATTTRASRPHRGRAQHEEPRASADVIDHPAEVLTEEAGEEASAAGRCPPAR